VIPLALVFLIQTADATPDVDVIGERLRRLRIAAHTDKRGRVTECAVTVSSGDPVVDRQACIMTRDCAAKGKRSGESMADCVDTSLAAYVRFGAPKETAR
jgi:hypothetical protein